MSQQVQSQATRGSTRPSRGSQNRDSARGPRHQGRKPALSQEEIEKRALEQKQRQALITFQNQAATNSENIKKILADLADYSDEEEENEGCMPESRTEAVFASYKQQLSSSSDGVSTDSTNSLSRTKDAMSRAQNEDCLICFSKIKVDQPIWQCDQCFVMCHLVCIQTYIRKRLLPTAELMSKETFPDRQEPPWLCPKCRCSYQSADIPNDYFCFCKKTKNPPVDMWRTAHTCEQQCGKALRPACGHKCVLLCHPGPCPPCPQTVPQAKCFCQKETSLRRCSARFYSCGKQCSKVLNCGTHRCEKQCHAGACDMCKKTSMQKCRCGRAEQLRPCSEVEWSCGQICKKQYSCGKHSCLKECHAGDCGPCPLSLPRKCFCGKKSLSNLACDEPTPSCGATCDKLLECGFHRCYERCHKGACGQCREVRLKTCRCGASKKEMACSQQFLCERKCLSERNCGRHKCKRKCCTGTECPPCEEVCGNKLRCRNHLCEQRCHAGSCLQCPLEVTLSCACGASQIKVPCGMEKYTDNPPCTELCKVPSFCHHPQRQPHHCHFELCPPCSQTCAISYRDCEHKCISACHDTLLQLQLPRDQSKGRARVNVLKVQQLAERAREHVESQQYSCPPCPTLVKRFCLGKHEEKLVVCSSPKEFKCNRACGNPLKCSNHFCFMSCHVITRKRIHKGPDAHPTEEVPMGEMDDSCMECDKACEKPRSPPCPHPCPRPCHPGVCAPCDRKVKKLCHCLSEVPRLIPCHRTHDPETLDAERSCGQICRRRLKFCTHTCAAMCHSGDCARFGDPAACKRKVTVTCVCKTQKAEWICKDLQEHKRSHPLSVRAGKDFAEVVEVLSCNEQCAEVAEKRRLEKEAAALAANKNQPTKRVRPRQEPKVRSAPVIVEQKSIFSNGAVLFGTVTLAIVFVAAIVYLLITWSEARRTAL